MRRPLFGRHPRRWIAGVAALSLLLPAAVTSAPAVAAGGGPSVPLPGTSSVSVTGQSMGARAQDEASSRALSGDQPSGAGAPEGDGTGTATPLSPSATWSVAEQTGDFNWSYPLRVPPAPGGLEPKLGLHYSSSTVDGRTSATNNQASWVGDGWDLSAGFIERGYGSCQDDKEGGTTPPKVGDLCWRSDNAVASAAAGGGMLIKDATTGVWRPKSDDGSRVERLTGAGNGDDNGEYWKITAVDGTQYFFGSRPAASSTWTVPVFGDDTGEPCHGSTFDASSCAQAWRWNLDKVIDRHGNVMLYSYDAETNSYGRNIKDDAVSYIRGGALRKIEYGLREGSTAQATGVVDFATADRCVPGSTCTSDKPDNWPDVPWTDKCDTAKCKDHYSPTFWNTKRLASITTKVLRGSAYSEVDRWTLDQQYPDPGDHEKAALWLKSVTHTGLVGGSLSMPPVTFEGAKMPNRVVKVDGIGPLIRYRITGIVSESGGVTSINYAAPDCTENSLPANPETNTKRCFPARWAKKNLDERTDYFQKYVVSSVVTSDRIAANPTQMVSYEYLDGAGWRYDDSEFTPPDKKTWNQYRGFARVRIRTGTPDDPAGPVGLTEQKFYRGMNGDHLPGGGHRAVKVTDSEGGSVDDEDWLQGFTRETTQYNGDGGPVVTKTISEPVWQGPTATRGDYKAYLVGTGTTTSYTALEAGGWRTARAKAVYDDKGQQTQAEDLGDLSTTADDQCTRTTYNRNTDRWLMAFVSRVETVAVGCGATPNYPTDALSDIRVSYDGRAADQQPLTGDVTTEERLNARPASGPQYYVESSIKRDDYGRATETTDSMGRVVKTAYTPSVGGPVTQTTTTNALNQVSTVTVDPAWGSTLWAVDENKRKTEVAYDALGRSVEMWQPNRDRSAGVSGSAKFSYEIRNDAPTAITSSLLGPNGRYSTSITLYDGLYRVRQTQKPAVGGGRLITDTRYDSQGRVFKSTQPYFNDAPVDSTLRVAADAEVPGLTFTEYDGAGRMVASIFKGAGVEKWRSTVSYGGDRVTTTPPQGGTAVTKLTDVRGEVTEQRQYHGSTPTGVYDTTRYTYTPAGKQETVTDPAGSVWRYQYDLRGREIKAEDPDKGTTTTAYDAAGHLASSVDARGQVLAYSYDLLGRKTAVRKDSADGPKLAEWTYDTSAGGIGKPASAIRYVGGNAYTKKVSAYTARYQPLVVSMTVPESEGALAGTYTSVLKYNDDGSPKGAALPAGGGLPAESINYTYDDTSLPQQTTGGFGGGTTTYVSDTVYTRYGEAQRIQLGEGTNRTWLSYYYDDNTRKLKRYIVDAEVPQPMQADVNFSYDPAGNITSVADTPQDKPADVQCFRYDYLQRMTEAWTPTGGCAAEPSTAGLGGPAPYWQSYSYDKVGNRLSEVLHTTAGDKTRTYAYPTAGSQTRPHAVQSVSTTGGGQDTFGYDAAGNTTSRSVGGRAQELTWNAEGQLEKVAEGLTATDYVYDADGSRLLRHDSTGTTLYLGSQELRLTKGTGQVVGTRYYTHGGKLVALRTAGKVSWIAGDQQGTPQIAIDSADLTVRQRRQTPFGATRGAPAVIAGERGFVGGTIDTSTDLTRLGARDYDQSTGKFLSVDPVLDAGNPQQLNAYAYANNSPVSFSDPSGMIWGLLKAIQDFVKAVEDFVKPWVDNPVRHNAVVKLSILALQGQVALKGGNPANVRPGTKVPGAAKGLNPNDVNGIPDIVYEGENRVYVWEVKSEGSYTAADAQKEVDGYVAAMQKLYPNKKVQSGWDLGIEFSFVFYGTGGPEDITVRGGGPANPGAIMYNSKRQPQPVPQPKPDPKDKPDNPVTTTGVPTPAPQPRSVPEPRAAPPTKVPCAPGVPDNDACVTPKPIPEPAHGIWTVPIGVGEALGKTVLVIGTVAVVAVFATAEGVLTIATG